MEGMETLETLDPATMVFGIIIVIIVVFGRIWFYWLIIKLIVNAIKRVRNHKFFKNNVVRNIPMNEQIENANGRRKNIYNDVSKTKLEMFNTDNIDSLKDYFFDIFLKFENAYNNLDYNMMKMLSTKQMFQNYYTGISLDLKVGQKKIIDSIERKKIIIYELDSTVVKQTVSAMIEISYITYTINGEGYIISGNREKPVTERFEVTFRKDFERNEITKCPNCGATITGNKCDFCRTTIKNVEFKISSIKRILDE